MRFAHVSTAFLLAGALASLTACWSESVEVSRKDCERLRDHLVELRMQSVTADHDQHLIAIRSSLDEDFVTTCVDGARASYIECALAAADSDGLGACAEPTPPPTTATAP